MNLNPFTRERVLARRLGKEPRTTVRAFPEGKAGRVVGTVGYLEEKLAAPLSGRPCVAWHVRVYGSTRGAESVMSCVEACDAATFTVADETGAAIVRADLVSLLLDPDLAKQLGLFGRASQPLLRFVRDHARVSARLVIDRKLRWTEAILGEGSRAAIIGRGRHEVDPESGEGDYRRAASRLVMTRDHEDEDILVSTLRASLR